MISINPQKSVISVKVLAGLCLPGSWRIPPMPLPLGGSSGSGGPWWPWACDRITPLSASSHGCSSVSVSSSYEDTSHLLYLPHYVLILANYIYKGLFPSKATF